jgi:hypothetical protein
MKHITFGNKGLMTGDEMAVVLIEYAAILANEGEAKSVDFTAYSDRGDKITATVLLGAGAPLMAETSHSDLPEPDNTLTVSVLQGEISVRTHPPHARQVDNSDSMSDDETYPA